MGITRDPFHPLLLHVPARAWPWQLLTTQTLALMGSGQAAGCCLTVPCSPGNGRGEQWGVSHVHIGEGGRAGGLHSMVFHRTGLEPVKVPVTPLGIWGSPRVGLGMD